MSKIWELGGMSTQRELWYKYLRVCEREAEEIRGLQVASFGWNTENMRNELGGQLRPETELHNPL